MIDTEVLEQLGLNKKEAETYIALVQLGSSLASTIANKTKINRSVTYEILEKLIRKGFVSYAIRENRKYFSATNPTKLIDLLKERERRLKEIIPGLLALQKIRPRGKESVEIYKGREGLKTVMDLIIKEKKDFLNLGYTAIPPKILKHWYWHWDRRRLKLKIHRTALANPASKKFINKLKLTKVRYLPKDLSMPLSTVIFPDKVILMLAAFEEPINIIIESKQIAKAYNNYFWFIWKLCK